eukprot:g14386.t1
MAALRLGDQELLVAVDQVIEGVHFDYKSATLRQIGRKAVTRNLSDIAAMAAKPLASLVSILLPKGFKEQDAEALLAAVRETAEAYGAPLIGGDTATAEGPLALSVTVLATADGITPVQRNGAQPGDAIYVTGELGGSGHAYDGRTHHLDFEPRLGLARVLAADPATRPTAMNDLSDGLARDLPHLVRGAEIDARALPRSPIARQIAARDGRPGWLHAVADGEDYELLFTASRNAVIPRQIDGVLITRVGEHCVAGDLIALQGELGAGKTQLVRGLAQGLGLSPRLVSSPTFVMVQEYEPPPEDSARGGKTMVPVLVHIDAYRIHSPDELESIGWSGHGDELREGAVVAIEWAKLIRPALGEDLLWVEIEHCPSGRQITLTASGAWRDKMQGLEMALRDAGISTS